MQDKSSVRESSAITQAIVQMIRIGNELNWNLPIDQEYVNALNGLKDERLFAAAPEMKTELETIVCEIERALDRGDLMTNCARDTACRRIASISVVLAQLDKPQP